jgi:hypothetical protein
VPVFGHLEKMVALSGTRSTPKTCSRSPKTRLSQSLFYQLDNSRLVGRSRFGKREMSRPHIAVIEVRLIAETERRVPCLELLGTLEKAYDIAVLGIRTYDQPPPGIVRGSPKRATTELSKRVMALTSLPAKVTTNNPKTCATPELRSSR